MLRDLDISAISDGRLYRGSDMAKLLCNDCKGCSKCCHDMGESIILDPFDIYNIGVATGLSFQELKNKGIIDITFSEMLVYPYLKMGKDNACSFLTDERCSIHKSRPGVCRLFPLGRIYEGDDFSYYLQKDECEYKNRVKCKIDDWIGYDDPGSYDRYICLWHRVRGVFEREAKSLQGDRASVEKLTGVFLQYFYLMPFEGDFFEAFQKRCDNIIKAFGG